LSLFFLLASEFSFKSDPFLFLPLTLLFLTTLTLDSFLLQSLLSLELCLFQLELSLEFLHLTLSLNSLKALLLFLDGSFLSKSFALDSFFLLASSFKSSKSFGFSLPFFRLSSQLFLALFSCLFFKSTLAFLLHCKELILEIVHLLVQRQNHLLSLLLLLLLSLALLFLLLSHRLPGTDLILGLQQSAFLLIDLFLDLRDQLLEVVLDGLNLSLGLGSMLFSHLFNQLLPHDGHELLLHLLLESALDLLIKQGEDLPNPDNTLDRRLALFLKGTLLSCLIVDFDVLQQLLLVS
jgi:hypothetical protein